MTEGDDARRLGTLPSPPVPTMLLLGIFLILLTAALRIAAGLLLPIAIAVLLTFLLAPAVRLLGRLGLSAGLGAALVVFGTLAIVGSGVVILARPAGEWMSKAPRTLARVESRIQRMMKPIQATANQVDRATGAPAVGSRSTVQMKTPGLLQRVGMGTASFAATTGTVVFLTYFLLAMLPTFRRRLAALIESSAGFLHAEAALAEIESQMSRYMVINTVTSFLVGLATWGWMAFIGLPSPLLWGAVAFFLNFIPYAGSLVTAGLVGVAALVTFDTTGPVLLAIGGSVVIQTIEGNLVTPHLMGRHLPLNPVAVFVGLLYWGWVWGAAGALLAVPITVMIQVVAARVDRLRSLAVLLAH